MRVQTPYNLKKPFKRPTLLDVPSMHYKVEGQIVTLVEDGPDVRDQLSSDFFGVQSLLTAEAFDLLQDAPRMSVDKISAESSLAVQAQVSEALEMVNNELKSE